MATLAAESGADSVESFRRDGWAVRRQLLSPRKLETLRQEAARLFARCSASSPRGRLLKGVPRSDRLDPVIDLSPSLAKLARSPELTELASEALGKTAQLFKDKLIFKPPRAPGYTPHQDGAYWQHGGFPIEDMVTIAIFLDSASAHNGAIECSSGKHGRLLTAPGIVDDVTEETGGPFVLVEVEAGDALLIHSLAPHRSGPNRGRTQRRVLFFTYGAFPTADLYQRYQASRAGSAALPQAT